MTSTASPSTGLFAWAAALAHEFDCLASPKARNSIARCGPLQVPITVPVLTSRAANESERFKRVALRCEKTVQNYGSVAAAALGFILVESVHTA